MKRWLAIGSIVLGGGIAFAAPTTSKASVELPSGAKLVGMAQVDEVRAFPEMNKNKDTKTNKSSQAARTEDIVDTGALDRVYETKQGYKDAVGYFDSMVKKGSATQISRTVTRTATGWELQLPDGATQNIIVRNTQPTTIETVQAVASFERDTFNNTDAKAKAKSSDSSMNSDSKSKMDSKSKIDAKSNDALPANEAAIKTNNNDNH